MLLYRIYKVKILSIFKPLRIDLFPIEVDEVLFVAIKSIQTIEEKHLDLHTELRVKVIAI